MRTAQKRFENAQNEEPNGHVESDGGTPSLKPYMFFLELTELGFQVWLDTIASKTSKAAKVDRQAISCISVVVNEHVSMLLLTLLDWMYPHADKASLALAENDFAPFELLLQQLHHAFTDPISCTLIRLVSWFNPEETFEVSPKCLEKLILISQGLSDPLLHDSLSQIYQSYCSMCRPCYLEELESQEEGSLAEAGKIDFSSENLASAGISWISVCNQVSSLPFTQCLLQEVLLGDYLYHTPLQRALEILSNFRSSLNEPFVQTLATLMAAALNMERAEQKDSVAAYRLQLTQQFYVFRILKLFFARYRTLPTSLIAMPPDTEENELLKAIQTLILEYPTSYTRTMTETSDTNLGLSVENSISLLPEFVVSLGRNHLLNHEDLLWLISNTGADVLTSIQEVESRSWTFSLNFDSPLDAIDGNTPLLDPDLASVRDSLRKKQSHAEFSQLLTVLTDEIRSCSHRFDQVSFIILDFLSRIENDTSFSDKDENGANTSDGLQDNKFALVFEYLSYSPVLELLLMAVPVTDLVEICLDSLVMHGDSTNESSIARFSSALHFLLHLLSITNAFKSEQVLLKIMEDIRDYAQAKHPEWLSDGFGPSSTSNTSSPLLEFLHATLTQLHKPSRAVATTTMDKMLNLVFDAGSSPAEYYAIPPWTWVSSLPQLLDMSLKLLTVKGPNDERVALASPLLDGLSTLAYHVPCLAPLIITYLAKELYFGLGDLNCQLQGSFIPFVLEKLVNLWILTEDRPYVRLVCLSHCKPALSQLLSSVSTYRESEWGQALSPLLQDAMFDRDEIHDLSLPSLLAQVTADPFLQPIRLQNTPIPLYCHSNSAITVVQGITKALLASPTPNPRLAEQLAYVLVFCSPQSCIPIFFDTILPNVVQRVSEEGVCALAHFSFEILLLSSLVPQFRLLPHKLHSCDVQLLTSAYRFYEMLIFMAKTENKSSRAILPLVFFQLASGVPGMLTLFESLTFPIFEVLLSWDRARTAVQAVTGDVLSTPAASPALEAEVLSFWQQICSHHSQQSEYPDGCPPSTTTTLANGAMDLSAEVIEVLRLP